MCHFISGYTAKVAGTEADVSEPRLNFQLALERPFYLFTRLSMQHSLEGK
jgi:ATP-dependent phosphoenolpyruvate carboxykinase